MLPFMSEHLGRVNLSLHSKNNRKWSLKLVYEYVVLNKNNRTKR